MSYTLIMPATTFSMAPLSEPHQAERVSAGYELLKGEEYVVVEVEVGGREKG